MQRAPRPQDWGGHTDGGGALIQRVPVIQPQILDGLTAKAGEGKQQRTERTVTEAGHPARQPPLGRGRQRGVGEDHRAPVTLENHFAHPGRLSPARATRRLVGERLPVVVAQQAHAKIDTSPLAAGGQRMRLAQPGAQNGIEPAEEARPPMAAPHCGRGALSIPLSLVPGLMPRWANQPRFISSA